MSTHNMGFYEEISKIISLSSSKTHFICSPDRHKVVLFFLHIKVLCLKKMLICYQKSVLVSEISVIKRKF